MAAIMADSLDSVMDPAPTEPMRSSVQCTWS